MLILNEKRDETIKAGKTGFNVAFRLLNDRDKGIIDKIDNVAKIKKLTPSRVMVELIGNGIHWGNLKDSVLVKYRNTDNQLAKDIYWNLFMEMKKIEEQGVK